MIIVSPSSSPSTSKYGGRKKYNKNTSGDGNDNDNNTFVSKMVISSLSSPSSCLRLISPIILFLVSLSALLSSGDLGGRRHDIIGGIGDGSTTTTTTATDTVLGSSLELLSSLPTSMATRLASATTSSKETTTSSDDRRREALGQDLQQQQDRQQQQQQQQQSYPGLCPHVLKLYGNNKTMLEKVIKSVEDATKFHTYGGSLRSIQRFLTNQIDHTLSDRLGIDYVPTTTTTTATSSLRGTGAGDDHPSTATKATAMEYLKEYYRSNDVPRGGYGQPLPIQFVEKNPKQDGMGGGGSTGGSNNNNNNQNEGIVSTALSGGRWIDVIERVSTHRWMVSVGPGLEPQCPSLLSFGKVYETKNFCVEPPTASAATTTPSSTTPSSSSFKHDETSVSTLSSSSSSLPSSSSCHIFSIGSNDQWGFEEELIKHSFVAQHDCHTHTFDCTLDGPPKNKPNDPKVHFYPYCVGESTAMDPQLSQPQPQRRQYLPYTELWKMTGIPSAPKILKMDIEGFEYDVLLSMLETAPADTWPEQIQMEVHYSTRMVDLEWMPRMRQSAELAMFFDTLYNVGGYMPVKRKYFPKMCPGCMEILMMRVQCRY